MRLLQGGRTGILGIPMALLCAAAIPAPAQLFNGGGLFNRKTEAPRAQTEDEIGVPVPVTGRVEALKGHEVTFEIRAESKTPGATVEFLIRAFPSAGKIVSMVSKPGERNKAIVTYWADPSSSATEDAFSFAVRYRGGRYSSEMRYDITLNDLKTEIQVPPVVEFGQVTIGSEAVQEVVVRNLGGAPMERQIFLAPPWYLVEPADGKLYLDPRGARVLKIGFRPELMGETSYFLSFSRSAAGTSKLIGSGLDPFQVLTESVEMVLDPETGVRTGTIELQNSGTKPLEIEARASTRLQSGMARNYLLAPGAVTKVQAKLAATDTAPFDGSVEFFLKNGYAKPVRLFAAVVPARLKLSVPNSLNSEIINYGQIVVNRSTERGLTVTNYGGVAVPLEFKVPEPFRLLTNPGKQLNPLSSVNLSVGLFPGDQHRGPVDEIMTVSGADQSLSIRLLANVVAPAGSIPAPPLPVQPTAPAMPLPDPPVVGNVPTPDPVRDPALPDEPRATMAGGMRAAGGTPIVAPGAISEPSFDLPPAGMTSIGADSSPQRGTIGEPSLDDLPPAPQMPVGPATVPKEGADWRDQVPDTVLEENRSPLGFDSLPMIQRNLDASLRRPEDLNVLKSGSTSIEIGWTAPKGVGPATYDVEVRGLSVDDKTGEPISVWAPYPAVKFEKIDRLVKARLSALNPYSQYEMRVVMTTDDGRSSPPSEAIVVKTELPMDWTYNYAILIVLLLGALGWAGWRIYLNRRPEVYQPQYVDP